MVFRIAGDATISVHKVHFFLKFLHFFFFFQIILCCSEEFRKSKLGENFTEKSSEISLPEIDFHHAKLLKAFFYGLFDSFDVLTSSESINLLVIAKKVSGRRRRR